MAQATKILTYRIVGTIDAIEQFGMDCPHLFFRYSMGIRGYRLEHVSATEYTCVVTVMSKLEDAPWADDLRAKCLREIVERDGVSSVDSVPTEE